MWSKCKRKNETTAAGTERKLEYTVENLKDLN
jgi:hypothetical protein